MKCVNVDVDKLYKILKQRGLTTGEVTHGLGVNASYFSNAKARGTINEVAVVALESKYNIPRESYCIIDTVEKEVSQPFTLTDDLKNELYKLLYSAMYHAIKQALSE